MSGTMQDLSTSVFTSDGKIMQIEYAEKCVNKANTILGVVCKDGVILGAEKQLMSNLMCANTDRRLHNIDTHVGMAIGGRIPDSRNVMLRARAEANGYTKNFDVPISGKVLASRVSQFVHQYTLYWGYRPLGTACILAAHDGKGYNLHMMQPSGECFGYYSCTAGKGRQTVRTQLDRRDFKQLTVKEALFHVAKALHMTHDDESTDKRYEIELSWICDGTKHVHQRVPQNLLEQASKEALASIEQDQMGSDDDDDEDDD